MASWSGSQNPVPILEKIYRDLHDIKLYLMPSYNEREGVNEAFLDAAAESAARNGLPLSKAAASVSAPDASVHAPAVEKAKKVLSPEHKAKMLGAAAAAREAKKAAELRKGGSRKQKSTRKRSRKSRKMYRS